MGVHHKDRRYVLASQQLRNAANANPQAVCWRDGLTLTQHQARHPGRALKWTAGHTRQGSRAWQLWGHITTTPPDGDWLAPEVSCCNYSEGASAGNRAREPHTETW